MIKTNIKKISIKKVILICVLTFILMIVGMIDYKYTQEFKIKSEKLRKVTANQQYTTRRKYTYSDILNDICKNEDIQVNSMKKNNNKANKTVDVTLQYKGDIHKFYNELVNLSKKENVCKVKNIDIDSIKGKSVNSLFICEFFI